MPFGKESHIAICNWPSLVEDFFAEHGCYAPTDLTISGKWQVADVVDKRERYKKYYIINWQTSPSGLEFPLITLHDFRSGSSQVFSGAKYLYRNLRFNGLKPASKIRAQNNYSNNVTDTQQNLQLVKNKLDNLLNNSRLTNSHPYLQRKFLSRALPWQCLVNGERLVIPIYDANGAVINAQTISATGRKLFIKGAKKQGGYALISGCEENHIYVCEGYATGLTIALLTGAMVYVALDAGNLLGISRQVVAKYSADKVIIAADNDWQKPANTGMTKALAAANACQVKLTYPRFKQSEEGSDFNDLFIINRDLAAQQVLQSYNFADLLDDYGHLLSKDSTKANTREKIINLRYLPAKMIGNTGLYFIESNTGTGKTEAIKQIFNERVGEEVLYIAHRIALTEHAAARLGISCYLQNDYSSKRLAICVNSILKLDFAPKILVIDEISQLLTHLYHSSGHIRAQLHDKLQMLIEQAELVIVMDNYLKDAVIEFFASSRHQMTKITNNYQIGKNKQVVINEHKNAVIAQIISTISQGKTAYIACDTRSDVLKIHNYLKYHFGNCGIAIDRTASCHKIAAFKNIRQFIENTKPKWLICSPAITSGIDISFNYFDYSFGIFTGKSINPHDCFQQLMRVRNQEHISIYIASHQQFRPTSKQEIQHKLLKNMTSFRNVTSHNIASIFTSVSLIAENHQEHNNFKQSLIKYLHKEGFTINNIEQLADSTFKELLLTCQTNHDNLQKQLSKITKDQQQQNYQQILQAHNLSKTNYNNYLQQMATSGLNQEELIEVEKYLISQFFASHKLSLEHIKLWQEGRLASKIELNLLTSNNQEITKAIKHQRYQYDFVFFKDALGRDSNYRQQILSYIGINFTKDGLINYNGTSWDQQTIMQTGLLEYLIKHREEINELKTTISQEKELPYIAKELTGEFLVKYIGMMLKQHGLTTISKGNKQRKYSLCLTTLKLINQAITAELNRLLPKIIYAKPRYLQSERHNFQAIYSSNYFQELQTDLAKQA